MFDSRPDAVFCCVNALSLASTEDQEKVMKWVRNRVIRTCAHDHR